MKYSSKYLTKKGCYELGNNIYENWALTCGFQPIDYHVIMKDYKYKLQEHNRLIKKFPFFIEIHSMFDFSNNYIYKNLYDLYGLPQGECVFNDVYNKPCNPIFSVNIFSPTKNNCIKTPTTVSIPHSHIGDWCLVFLSSDDFDRGFERVYFKNKLMLDTFITIIILGDHNSYNILD